MVKILITVVALLLIVFFISRRTKYFLITPQFAFVVSMIPSLITLSLFIDKWSVDLSNKTILLIISGAFVFTVSSLLSERLFRKNFSFGRFGKADYSESLLYEEPLVENTKLVLFGMAGFMGVLIYFVYVSRFSGSFSIRNLSQILKTYRDAYNEETLDMPTYVSLASMIATCIADYCVFYYFKHKKTLKEHKTKKRLLILCCLPGLIIPVLSGARGGIINFGLFVFAAAVINAAKEVKLQRKTIRIAVVLAVIAVISLRAVGVLMGRTIGESTIDYIGIYLPASIKNLDYTIQTENIGAFTGFGTGNRTFSKLLTFLSFRFGLSVTPVDERKFKMFNGYNTGNMYTVYYNLLHDAGFVGALLLLALTAFLCQFFFVAIRKRIQGQRNGDTGVIVYTIIYSCLYLSFFNENFFFTVFTNYFVRQVIFLLLIDWFVKKTRVRVNRQVAV